MELTHCLTRKNKEKDLVSYQSELGLAGAPTPDLQGAWDEQLREAGCTLANEFAKHPWIELRDPLADLPPVRA